MPPKIKHFLIVIYDITEQKTETEREYCFILWSCSDIMRHYATLCGRTPADHKPNPNGRTERECYFFRTERNGRTAKGRTNPRRSEQNGSGLTAGYRKIICCYGTFKRTKVLGINFDFKMWKNKKVSKKIVSKMVLSKMSLKLVSKMTLKLVSKMTLHINI